MTQLFCFCWKRRHTEEGPTSKKTSEKRKAWTAEEKSSILRRHLMEKVAISTLGEEPGVVTGARITGSLLNAALAFACLAMLFSIVIKPLRINHDCALSLHHGQLLSEGKLIYVDFINPDFPLMNYLCSVVHLTSSLMRVDTILVFSLFVFLVSVVASLVSLYVIRTARCEAGSEFLEVLTLVFFAVSFGFFRYQIGSFGQREHLFAMLYFPFFVFRWARWEGGNVSGLVGCLTAVPAAIGACLKPYFVPVCFAPEIYWLVAKRRGRNLFRAEALVFALIGLIYAGHFFFLPGLVKAELFGRWLPFIAAKYHVYNNPFGLLVSRGEVWIACLMIVLSLVVYSRSNKIWSMACPLAAFTAASLFIYFLQHKGWRYHLVPALYGSLLIWTNASLLLTEYVFRRSGPRMRSTTSIAISLAALLAALILLLPPTRRLVGSSRFAPVLIGLGVPFLAAFFYASEWIYSQLGRRLRLVYRFVPLPLLAVGALVLISRVLGGTPYDEPALSGEKASVIRQYTKAGEPVLFISTDVGEAYPLLLQLNRRPGSRYVTTFPIAMLYAGVRRDADGRFPYRTGEFLIPEEKRFLEELGEDIAKLRPRLILIDNDGRYQACPEGFVPKEYLRVVGFVQWAMGNYVQIPSVSDDEIFLRAD
jgi:hypothetical protein